MSLGPGDVSVVMPARADEPYIEEALDSAIGEGAGEVLVVAPAGGSSEEAAGARQVSLIEPRGKEPTVRRNQGVREASLPVVALLDADDLFTPGRLAKMTALLGDAVTGLVRQFASPDCSEEVLQRFRVDPTPGAAVMPSVLVARREALLALDGLREDLTGGDAQDWLDRAAVRGMEVARLDEVVLERRIHAGHHNSLEEAAVHHRAYLRLARARILRSRAP